MPVPVSYSSSSSILLGFRYANHMGKLAEVRIMASYISSNKAFLCRSVGISKPIMLSSRKEWV
jgi:hypothetical protein